MVEGALAGVALGSILTSVTCLFFHMQVRMAGKRGFNKGHDKGYKEGYEAGYRQGVLVGASLPALLPPRPDVRAQRNEGGEPRQDMREMGLETLRDRSTEVHHALGLQGAVVADPSAVRCAGDPEIGCDGFDQQSPSPRTR